MIVPKQQIRKPARRKRELPCRDRKSRYPSWSRSPKLQPMVSRITGQSDLLVTVGEGSPYLFLVKP